MVYLTNLKKYIMKRAIILPVIYGVMMFQGGNLVAQEQESQEQGSTGSKKENPYAHWSLGLRAGGNQTEYAKDINSSDGLGVTVGGELERTFNPYWGLSLGYTYIGYELPELTTNDGKKGRTHEIVLSTHINLANLLAPCRGAQQLNVYANVGGGLSIYTTPNRESANELKYDWGNTIVVPTGLSIEYNVTPRLAFSIAGDRRWHLTRDMIFRTQEFADHITIWTITAGVRFKFGKKPHVRNVRMAEYEPPCKPYNNSDVSAIKERLDKVEENIQNLQDTVIKSNEELKKAVEDANAKIESQSQNQRVVAPINPYLTPKVYLRVEFAPAQYNVRPYYQREVDDVVATMIAYPNIKIQLVGHTDDRRYNNVKLSEDRANTVKEYLVSKGVDASRISVKGMADKDPIDSNSTPEGRQRNRRVEAIFVE
jgi:outer membrane protein OmpA-like peptidoglycan-associated protein